MLNNLISYASGLFLGPLAFSYVWNHYTSPGSQMTYGQAFETNLIATLPFLALGGLMFMVVGDRIEVKK